LDDLNFLNVNDRGLVEIGSIQSILPLDLEKVSKETVSINGGIASNFAIKISYKNSAQIDIISFATQEQREEKLKEIIKKLSGWSL
jgi:hypothetical protein